MFANKSRAGTLLVKTVSSRKQQVSRSPGCAARGVQSETGNKKMSSQKAGT
jgi:hypothetical protein